jgi:DNA polymerase I-like protein with 3'-5' exonuclease and polymerase domains
MTKALFIGTIADESYLPHIRKSFGQTPVLIYLKDNLVLLSHLSLVCKSKGATCVISTSTKLLSLLVKSQKPDASSFSLSDYQGSLFVHDGIEIVFIPPLEQLFTVPYGKFLADRYISKVIFPSKWAEPTKFSWSVASLESLESFHSLLDRALLLACDIETFSNPLSIRCIGYTALHPDPTDTNKLASTSIVIPLDSLYNLAWMRKINDHAIPKAFQNGKYDCAYLLRYNSAPQNYIFDTAHFMHSWYSELPKDLAYQNAFFLRSVVYWKDLAETYDLHEYYRYCALDTWATANIACRQLYDSPAYAKHNYILQFPVSVACVLSEHTGLLRDPDLLSEARAESLADQSKLLTSLQKITGHKQFNPSSPPQVRTLLKILGCADIESSGEADLQKAAFRHPLNDRILSPILDYRGERKLSSTYLTNGADAKEFGTPPTILYALNPHSTDTGRLASREHQFWCGLQVQNIPRGSNVKSTLRAPDGFVMAEADLEQAESRDTAHIIGDEKYIAAVTGTRDFHSVNASAFFGIPYGQIYSDELRKTLNKKIRDLAKRVNHGANYNMGPRVLVQTMGLKAIFESARVLGLRMSDPLAIAEYLLSRFHQTYSGLQQDYYPYVKQQIAISSKLISRAYHHTPYNIEHHPDPKAYIETGDWTRYCFGNPEKSKPALNAYVAHGPQSLNARTLNEAYMRVYNEVALPNPTTFRLHAQIHDSILFSFAVGHEHHADQVKERMEIPVTVKDVRGKYRTFTVPASVKIAANNSPYWGDIE